MSSLQFLRTKPTQRPNIPFLFLPVAEIINILGKEIIKGGGELNFDIIKGNYNITRIKGGPEHENHRGGRIFGKIGV